MHSLEGTTLGRYRVIEQLGRGGMAIVFKGYHAELDRYVAIKVLQSFLVEGEDFRTRFSREAKTVASLRHPNIVQVYDYDVQEDLPFMVMEFIDGKTLKARLSELQATNDVLPMAETLAVFRQIADALHYAHGKGLYHRDVKPANVLIDTEDQVYLTDFGIARIVSDTAFTASGAFLGTPSYIAPEQAMGEPITRACDIYSLGVVLYELVTGKVPFDADTPLAVIQQHISAPLPMPSSLRSDIPDELERVILRALSKEPEDRHSSAADMLKVVEKAIEPALQDQAPRAEPAEAAPVEEDKEASLQAGTLASDEERTLAPQRIWAKRFIPAIAIIGVLAAVLAILGISTLMPPARDQTTRSLPAQASTEGTGQTPEEPETQLAAIEPSPAIQTGPVPVRLHLATLSDFTSLRLADGGEWSDMQIVQSSQDAEVLFEQDGTILLQQPCRQESDCIWIETVIDLTVENASPDGELVFRTERGHWGWTEWKLMNALGPEPVEVASAQYRDIIPGGVVHVVSSATLVDELMVFVNLGSQLEGYRLRLRPSEVDGLHELVELDGLEARQTIPMQPGAASSFLYFEVDDSFYFDAPQVIEIEIEYFDRGDEWIVLDYDTAPAGANPNDPRAFADVGVVKREDTQTWKTASVVIDDARFTNHQHGAYDFRLSTGTTPLAVRYVQLTKMP